MKEFKMFRRSVALATVLSLGVAACSVGPKYVRPDAPISVSFKEALGKEDGGWTPAAPADTLDKGQWWTLFGDPQLNDLAAKVEVSNQNIIAAEAAYRQARALVSEQRAALFPTIDLTGSATRSGGGSGSGGTASRYQLGIGTTWEPDVWGRIRKTIEAARANAQASEADLAAARLSAQGELVADYVGLREADAEAIVDKATVDGYQRTLTITQNQYNAGIAPHSDVLQAKTQLDNAQADLVGTQQTRATYEHAIAVLTGQAPGSFSIIPAATWTPVIPDIPPGVPSELLQRRPDIAAAERRMAAANAQIGIARSAYFPTFNLTGSAGGSGSELGNLFSASGFLWSIGASVAETIFDAGARKAQVAGARAAYDQAVAQYRQTVLTALQDVENQLVAGRILAQQYALRQDASASADAAETMVINQYKAGQVSYVQVVTAQAAAYSARRTLLQSAAQRETTAAALIQSLGGGWRAPGP